MPDITPKYDPVASQEAAKRRLRPIAEKTPTHPALLKVLAEMQPIKDRIQTLEDEKAGLIKEGLNDTSGAYQSGSGAVGRRVIELGPEIQALQKQIWSRGADLNAAKMEDGRALGAALRPEITAAAKRAEAAVIELSEALDILNEGAELIVRCDGDVHSPRHMRLNAYDNLQSFFGFLRSKMAL
jgi:predicted  nucleic acid-binding Zn-ribbon protein